MTSTRKFSPLLIISLSLFVWTTTLTAQTHSPLPTKKPTSTSHVSTLNIPEAPILNPNYPKRYTVKENDTLWDISSKILQYPWQWEALLATNPKLKHRHRIYPGDVIQVSVKQQQPVLTITQTGTAKLSPKIRSMPLDNAIPTIPLVDIKPFISGNRIVAPHTLTHAPTIVAHEGERIIAGSGDVVYVSGLHSGKGGSSQYSLFRRGETFTNPKTKQVIGINAIYVGDAELLKPGEPATLILSNTHGEVIKGDKLLPRDTSDLQIYFTPKMPKRPIHGNIISLEGGLAQVGQYQVVVLDQGTQDGLAVGDVLDIYTNPRMVTNIGDDGNPEKPIEIPGYKSGEMMIFRTFYNASYALILKASNIISIMDTVTNPKG